MALPTASQLAASSKCFTCLDDKTQMAVQTYLLATTANSVAGTSMDPATLARAAKCFACLTKEQQLQVQLYLLCAILNA